MRQTIQVTTKATLFEQRKQEYLQAGYLIENEQPAAMNGMCSFVAVRPPTDDDSIR